MDIYEIRNQLKSTGRTLTDMPLRVVYYARVSTDKDEQLNSLDNQRSYYEDFISANKNWQLVGSYIDEGLSGITTKNREKFHSMVDDAKAGKFDFVITKEISRFARNTLDSIQFTRELLSHGVAVWFQQDSINTIDDDSEMRLAIMSSLAQEESRRLSSRIRFGHSEAIKKGTVMGNSRIYGYNKADGKLVINEKEAEMVRLVYELYATGDYSTPKIERILEEKGYRNFKGGLVNRNVLRKIIPNPKYKGYYCGNKVKIVDMFTKKQKFLDESEWEMYPAHESVPPIVSEELWVRANAIFAIRSAEVKERRTSFKTDNLFTGKIFCVEHGTPFYMKQRSYKSSPSADPTWVCSHRIKNGKDSCATIGLRETELTEVILDVLDGLSGDFDGLVEQYMQLLEAAQDVDMGEARLSEITDEIAKISVRKEKLIDLAIEGQLSNAEVGTRNDVYNEQIATLELEVKKIKGKQKEKADYSNTINRFKKELRRYFDDSRSNSGMGELTPGIINALIDKIYVTATSYVSEGGNETVPSFGENMMHLEVRLNTGLVVDSTLPFPLRRSGDTFKKMIEAQERQMAGKQ
ncbi:MAG: recombinase family protein [Defluviitaleaceae bacterium]|nr:recombinase family protein [Defluviitaleaceae bacterium]MCL2239451.1 recombinase family protein [Defluviitaleaceae bacterium]